MARFFGAIGYGTSVEVPLGSGIWVDDVTEVEYYGEITRNTRKLEPGEGLNDNVSVGNSITIVADQYASEHFYDIRYIRWNNVLWTVSTVEVQSPRLIISLGKVYNGPLPPTYTLTVIDHDNGTWSVIGPADRVIMTDATTFQIIDIDAVFPDADSYTITSTLL